MEARGRGRRPGSKNYSREFREMVAAEANHPERSISEVAKEHGLNANMVSKWRRDQASRAQPGPLAPVPEQSFLPVQIAPLSTQRSAVIVERGALHVRFEGPTDLDALRVVLASLRDVP
ncbi:transposase [Cupriavidus sp. DL-D2]|jgi:transposase|uniref:transposase n=1 Tax=Cupriavidus sp. DL-D2 TaxID=3144974 RepID=UPI0032131AF0